MRPDEPQTPDVVSGSHRSTVEPSLNEWLVLALLVERPAHGFAIARELRPGTDLGRVLTVHRPLVYRALDRLVTAGLAEPHHTEPGDAGPNRTLHRATAAGREALESWLDRPVAHVRDLRIEFVAKVRLNERRSRDPRRLIEAQRKSLAATLDHLTTPAPDADVVDLWRRHSAAAARTFLDSLATDADPI